MYLVTNRLLGMKYLSHPKGALQNLGISHGMNGLNPLFVGIPGGRGRVPLRGTDRPESAAETMVEQITRVVSSQLFKDDCWKRSSCFHLHSSNRGKVILSLLLEC